MAYGKSIELFLVNGTADSLITAELSNWNGKAIKIPRIEIPTCNREDIKQAGVYFLFCKGDNGKDSVYIGEAENVKERLVQHLRDAQSEKEKYYWNTAVIFIGRDLNKALIRYLENRFVEIARNCNRYEVITKNTYKNTVLKESQIASMEEFVDNVRILINALGYKVLDAYTNGIPIENSVSDEQKKENVKLYLERVIKNVGKIEAQGTVTSEGFIVLKGSQISPVDDSTVPDTIKGQRRSSNIIDGILQNDMLFSSPSGAAMFVVGKSDNGLTRWKDENGRTLKEIENSEMLNEN